MKVGHGYPALSVRKAVQHKPHHALKIVASLLTAFGMTLGVGLLAPLPAAATTEVTVTPSRASFGSVPVGLRNSQTIKVENNLRVPLRLSSLTISQGEFAFADVPSQLTIAAHSYLTFTVLFTPRLVKAYAAWLHVYSEGVDVATIVLSGTGVTPKASLSISSSALSFGDKTVGTKTTLPITVKSDGNLDVTISSVAASGSGFAVSGIASDTVLRPGQSATLDASFTPATASASTGKVAIRSNATSSPSIALSGTGVSATSSSSSPASVALRWDAISNAVGYCVYRALTSGGPYTKLSASMISAADYVDLNVVRGQTYYYVVTSVNANDVESSYSNQAEASVPNNP